MKTQVGMWDINIMGTPVSKYIYNMRAYVPTTSSINIITVYPYIQVSVLYRLKLYHVYAIYYMHVIITNVWQ